MGVEADPAVEGARESSWAQPEPAYDGSLFGAEQLNPEEASGCSRTGRAASSYGWEGRRAARRLSPLSSMSANAAATAVCASPAGGRCWRSRRSRKTAA